MPSGGARIGAGKKKGSKHVATLNREVVLKAYRELGMSATRIIFNSQLHLAIGQTFLYKIEKEVVVGPKGGKTIRAKPPKLVTEQWEIESFLMREVNEMNGEAQPLDREDTYYFLTTKEPRNDAADSILDRTFGKATQAIELAGKDGKPLFDDESKAKSKAIVSQYLGISASSSRPRGSEGN